MERYNFKIIENKWQSYWDKNNIFKSKIDKTKKKFYCLEMFPYPSGRIHMGHVRNYTIGDVLARYKIMKGFNVLHPMGWDYLVCLLKMQQNKIILIPKFGLRKNIDPMKISLNNLVCQLIGLEKFQLALKNIISTNKLFLELFDKGLVYRKENYVNWDPVDETVLANEQVIDGKGWRSGVPVQEKAQVNGFLTYLNFLLIY